MKLLLRHIKGGGNWRVTYQSAYQVQKCFINMSSIYRPANVEQGAKKVSKKTEDDDKGNETHCKSLKLLVENGLIHQSSCPGAYHLLPVGLKALEKLVSLVDDHMSSLPHSQKIQMPTLTSAALWKATGRLEECQSELMRVFDKHSKELLLSPTHEESICSLIASSTHSHKQLPKRLYQITEKFRDELRPRFGLLRGRQFLMKDLYTFDVDLQEARATYDQVNEVYKRLLNSLGLNFIQARGTTGIMGGMISDEFHLQSDVGEDSVITCSSCKQSHNVELVEEQQFQNQNQEKRKAASGSSVVKVSNRVPPQRCLNCLSTSLSGCKTIEVAHSFLLSTKYTKPLNVTYADGEGKHIFMEMGCYGLGVSRLLGASIEVLSTDKEIRWPLRIAPYIVSIIPPKDGSREEVNAKPLATKMYDTLKKILPRDVIYDDRINQSIGKRLLDNKKLGIPFVIVCGKSLSDNPAGPLFEFHDTNSGTMVLKDINEIANCLYDVKSKISKINS